VVTVNVHSLIKLFMLRLGVRAAPEIRELAMHMHKLCLEEYPENEVRPNECLFKKLVPKKHELKEAFEARARRIIEGGRKGF